MAIKAQQAGATVRRFIAEGTIAAGYAVKPGAAADGVDISAAGTGRYIAIHSAVATEEISVVVHGHALAVAGGTISLTSAVIWLKSDGNGKLVQADTDKDPCVGYTWPQRGKTSLSAGDEFDMFVVPSTYTV